MSVIEFVLREADVLGAWVETSGDGLAISVHLHQGLGAVFRARAPVADPGALEGMPLAFLQRSGNRDIDRQADEQASQQKG